MDLTFLQLFQHPEKNADHSFRESRAIFITVRHSRYYSSHFLEVLYTSYFGLAQKTSGSVVVSHFQLLLTKPTGMSRTSPAGSLLR